MLRRGHLAPTDASATDRVLRVDALTHQLMYGAGAILLTPTEYRLLAHLIAAAGNVVRRSSLRAVGWPAGAIVSDNTLDQFIAKLRRRLSAVDAPQTISVVRGVGYVMR
jgi:two-component system response regulator MprA